MFGSLTLALLRLHGRRTKSTYSGARRIDPDPSNIVGDHQRSSNGVRNARAAQTHEQNEEQQGQAVVEIAKAVSSGEDGGDKAETCFWQEESVNENMDGGDEWNFVASVGGTITDDNNSNEETTCTTTENGDKGGNNVNHKDAFAVSRTRKPSGAKEVYSPSYGGRKSSHSTAVGNVDSPSTAPAIGNCGSAPISAEALENRGVSSVGSPSSGSGDGIGTTNGGVSESRSIAWFLVEDIEVLNLHSLSLQKLDGIERLLRLKVADLSGNELHDTAPLQPCSCLEVRVFRLVTLVVQNTTNHQAGLINPQSIFSLRRFEVCSPFQQNAEGRQRK